MLAKEFPVVQARPAYLVEHLRHLAPDVPAVPVGHRERVSEHARDV